MVGGGGVLRVITYNSSSLFQSPLIKTNDSLTRESRARIRVPTQPAAACGSNTLINVFAPRVYAKCQNALSAERVSRGDETREIVFARLPTGRKSILIAANRRPSRREPLIRYHRVRGGKRNEIRAFGPSGSKSEPLCVLQRRWGGGSGVIARHVHTRMAVAAAVSRRKSGARRSHHSSWPPGVSRYRHLTRHSANQDCVARTPIGFYRSARAEFPARPFALLRAIRDERAKSSISACLASSVTASVMELTKRSITILSRFLSFLSFLFFS